MEQKIGEVAQQKLNELKELALTRARKEDEAADVVERAGETLPQVVGGRTILEAEINLHNFASFIFTPGQTRGKATRPRVKAWSATDRATGNKVLAQLIVHTMDGETLTAYDYRTLLGLTKLWWDRPRDPETGETTIRLVDLATAMRIGWGGKTLKALLASLMRIRGVLTTWRYSFYDKASNTYRDLKAPINILSKLRIRVIGRKGSIEGPDGVVNAEGKISFRFSEPYERNLQEHGTGRVYLDVALGLKGFDLVLYAYLAVIMADKVHWEHGSLELFRDVLVILTDYPYPGNRKRVLKRAAEKLNGKSIPAGGTLRLRVAKMKEGRDCKLVVDRTPGVPQIPTSKRDPEQEYLVNQILAVTSDEHSRAYYQKVVRELPEGRVFGLISETRQADRDGRIQTTKARYFTDLAEQALGHRPGRGLPP